MVIKGLEIRLQLTRDNQLRRKPYLNQHPISNHNRELDIRHAFALALAGFALVVLASTAYMQHSKLLLPDRM